MNAKRFWAMSALPLALAACGGGDDAKTDAAADSTVAAAPAAPAPAAPAAPANTGPKISMDAIGGKGMPGEMQLMAHGASETMITVSLMDMGTGASGGHVHEGTCAEPGKVVAPLQDVAPVANGQGSATSTVPVALSTLGDGKHIVVYHERTGTDHGNPVSCGAIPAGGGAA
ncbi:MAG TPA: hypothetical protein VF665_17165 [Longimicrobium sp.]|uniref:hypothetical protein n=1 Tax=Longimicrobium sp. TaxID=2029185 RepID=UPI002EDB1513